MFSTIILIYVCISLGALLDISIRLARPTEERLSVSAIRRNNFFLTGSTILLVLYVFLPLLRLIPEDPSLPRYGVLICFLSSFILQIGNNLRKVAEREIGRLEGNLPNKEIDASFDRVTF